MIESARIAAGHSKDIQTHSISLGSTKLQTYLRRQARGIVAPIAEQFTGGCVLIAPDVATSTRVRADELSSRRQLRYERVH